MKREKKQLAGKIFRLPSLVPLFKTVKKTELKTQLRGHAPSLRQSQSVADEIGFEHGFVPKPSSHSKPWSVYCGLSWARPI